MLDGSGQTAWHARIASTTTTIRLWRSMLAD
jgi:hypothetical protein